MAGEIKHKWTGTILTVTSDSGTSSCDLKGKQGERGVRGAQGRAGVILKDDGSVDMNGYATEAYVDDLFASFEGGGGDCDLSNYYTKDEIDATIAELELSGGGSGGGSDNNAVLKLQNLSDWLSKSIAEGGSCSVKCTWSSEEDGIPTGSGLLTVTVDGVVKHSASIPQGNFTVDVSKYLKLGSNKINVAVEDAYANRRSINYTVTVVSLSISSPFDASIAYEGEINFSYTPIGSVKKSVHFILDGKEVNTVSIASSGRAQSYTIPAQKHGSHTFEVYFTAVIDSFDVESNHLVYDLICVESGNNTPIISLISKPDVMMQYAVKNVEYIVYTPNSLSSDIELRENDKLIKQLTVDRTKQTWDYKPEMFGSIELSIVCGDVIKSFTVEVAESSIDVEAVTEALELHLSSYGRSNNEANPAEWKFNDISCRFKNYNWISDGWLMDSEGISVHRVSGDARLTIPLQLFKNDFRTTGKTIEFEFATRDVRDYDAEIINCMSDGKGFRMTAQKAVLKSEQTELSTQYKEDEHIRLSFVVEKRAENRLIYIYLNGIMCGATQYPDDDDFSQGNPVNIVIGSNLCTIDLYNIRVYNNNLTRYDILDNWISDTQDINEKIERYNRNNVFDDYDNIVIDKLPKDLPYLILRAPKLPEAKGNELSVDGEYVNPINPKMNFTFTNALADVQGTSSAGYARKNYKIKFANGIIQNGELKEAYQMRDDSIPTATFTFKADVASSEGANNVELVRLYDEISPYKTPPQLTNANVRQGIDGFPIVIFHDDGDNITFIGKYNFNNDKGTPEVFGFSEGDESWEIKNNTSDRVIWKKTDFEGTDWQNDFEARYPKDNVDVTNLSRFAEWVKSTDREQATNEAITPVVYEEVEYTTDTPEYRLAKFKAEIENYAELQSSLFYYLFTELFLMVDSRAKNAFPTMFDENGKVCWLPYDMDTAVGTNNEGALVFGYELEDTDTTSTGADVFNGQDSVFWCNIRDAFSTEIATMYQKLRSDEKINYDIIETAYEEHQKKWSEAIWNDDAFYKYLQPLIEDGSGIYLPMLQGSKEEQRKWWLYNRFRYIDSKYNAGDSKKDFITLRGYAKSDIDITPYADIYATILYGSYLVQKRAFRNNTYTLECPLDKVNDTEIYIYSASQLKDIGDISGLKVGLADFSMATRLQNLKIGDSSSTYSNENLLALTLGNNVLLNTLDVRNCTNLGTGEQQSVDVSGCTNIEHIYLEGTAVKSVKLPNGGMLKTLHLPDSVNNLKLVNQTSLTDFVLNDYSNITTLRIENSPMVDSLEVFKNMKSNGRIRLLNIDWVFTDADEAFEVMNKLNTMRGLDENDNNTEVAQISGSINVPYQCESYLSEWESKYPTITFVAVGISLESADWEYISECSRNGSAQRWWHVGDEKSITLSTGEEITVVIYGFEHDDLSDGTGKAGITFGMKDCLNATSIWDTIDFTSYSGSDLRANLLKYVDYLPEDLQSVLKPVTKISKYDEGMSSGVATSTTNDKLFVPAHIEIFGINDDVYADSYAGEGTQYEYFASAPIPEGFTGINGDTGSFYSTDSTLTFTDRFGNTVKPRIESVFNYNAIKGVGNNPTSSTAYWTRSADKGTNTSGTYHTPYYVIVSSGSTNSRDVTDTANISFAFCV